MSAARFDPGLQPERTELAWRRTALALGVGSLLALRVVPAALPSHSWTALLPGITGLLFALWLWRSSARRYRAVTAWLTGPSRAPAPGAGPLLALALFSVAAGIAGVVLVIVLQVQGPA